jgi:hypothetical protein
MCRQIIYGLGIFSAAALIVALAIAATPAFASHGANLTGDGQVNEDDLAILRSQWGQSGTADLNHDGIVNFRDAGILFSSWGTITTTPPPPPTPPPPTTGCSRTFSGNVTLSRLDIAPSEVVCFDPNTTTTIQSSGNVVVRGILRMRPANTSVIHTLRFINIDESKFVGGHTESTLDSDVGLWIIENGLWDAEGAAKTAWTRVAGGLSKGATTITLSTTPTNWRVGDELVIAPTLPPTVSNHFDAYDYPTITAISGSTVTLNGPLAFDHPAVTVALGKTMTAEVLNLTRNVRVEGQPGKRAHIIWNMAIRPPVIKYLAARFMGPQRPPDSNGNVRGVLGRYGFHVHLMGEASRGGLFEGVVGRDMGNWMFVPHA